jgi:hypothetical protein
MSTSIPPPILENLSAALELFEVPGPALRAFGEKSHENLAFDFSEALCESPFTIVTDWKFNAGDVLREIFLLLYAVGIKGMIEAEDEETLNPTSVFLQINGIGSRYKVKVPNDPDLHDIVFAFTGILPDIVQIHALVSFDGSDTYGHTVAAKEVWQRAMELLGPWFAEIWRGHAAKPLFKKVGKDVKPKRDFIKKYVKQAREWLERMKDDFDRRREEVFDVLAKNLNSEFLRRHPGESTMQPQHREARRKEWITFVQSPERLRLANLYLWGSVAGAEGLLALSKADAAGWRKLRRCLEYYYWDVVIIIRFSGAEYFGLGDFGNKLALAIVMQEWETADFFCRRMLHHAGFRVAGSPLSRFLLRLYSFRNPAIFDGLRQPEESYGVYGIVLAAWNDPAKLAGALDVICDYHMMRTGDDHEFSVEPFYAFAAEVLAIYRIRDCLGLETPHIEHQLLDAPWRDLPDRVPLEPNALLEKLQQVVHDEVTEVLTRQDTKP